MRKEEVVEDKGVSLNMKKIENMKKYALGPFSLPRSHIRQLMYTTKQRAVPFFQSVLLHIINGYSADHVS